ncbi:DAR GTPase 2, mitochondrial isoform X2 [Olea europaea var. sylvestris]|uniref:DAR GTPase 2, mitochondrial isoform X2 n=1 Tax=Olea europaea var. sylvestris TaxID=158386 RepID=UPI000C1D7973|nr:DAR GTPase 2, mitochondrial isoform X2 [Olea europaea var. sylvestris]
MDSLVQKLGKAVKQVARSRGSNWWYTPHMAAASRAIADRIPLVNFVIEVRDARIPISSECEQLRNFPPSLRRIIVLNKTDLANRSQMEFLNFLQARVRELKKLDSSGHTITLMLVGIPNVGKSALANALHQVGRISAAEKGKLKHAVISPYPGETKNITSFKIASHPNIFVLDTPGVLPPEVTDDRVCSNLALAGAIRDCVVGEIELAQYFLSILSLSDEYKKWGKLVVVENGRASINQGASILASSESGKRQDRQYPTDHTQDFIVNNVRRALFEAISSFAGNAENEEDLARLIEVEFKVLHRVFHLPKEFDHDENYGIVATKLLNLYRTGRLGHYTLDPFPKNAWCSSSEMI